MKFDCTEQEYERVLAMDPSVTEMETAKACGGIVDAAVETGDWADPVKRSRAVLIMAKAIAYAMRGEHHPS